MEALPQTPDVLLSSSSIPAEWVLAHRMRPRMLFAAPGFQSGPLAAGVCAYSQFVARRAGRHGDCLAVFASTCDQLRREFDFPGSLGSERRFLLNVPTAWESPNAVKLFRAELTRLGAFLERHGGRRPSPELLETTMTRCESEVARLRNVADHCAGLDFAKALAKFHWEGVVEVPVPAPVQPGTVPLALLGGPCPVFEDVITTIDTAGGRVCLNATEAGERSLFPRASTGRGSDREPLEALAAAYLSGFADVSQRPNTPLYAWLGHYLARRGARGIVLWTFSSCDLWRAEAASLRDAFRLPVLVLEGDESGGWNSRAAGRIQALVEMLRRDATSSAARFPVTP